MYYSLIVCFFVITLKTVVADIDNVAENPEILLNCSNRTEKKYVVDKSKPLKLILQNCQAEIVRCHNHYFIENVYQDPFIDIHNTNNIINITTVTDAMSTRWTCELLEEYHGGISYMYKNQNYTAVPKSFFVHVKGARSVNISVNSVNLKIEATDLNVTEYDGDSRYLYIDGETIEYVCNPQSKPNTVNLKYYDGEGTLLFESMETAALSQLRSTFRSRNNKSYIICILNSSNPREKYLYKTTFMLRNPDLDETFSDSDQRATEISVNGLKLVPLPSKDSEDKNIDLYHYRYIEGDVLNVTCEKRKQINGNLELHFPENSDFPRGGLESRDETIVVSLDTSQLIINKKVLSCSINNSDVKKIFAKILFVSDLPMKGVRLRGLSPKNVEYQYSSGGSQYIGYQYKPNETLHLTCIFRYDTLDDKNRLQWKFDGHTINAFLHTTNTEVLIQSAKENIILEERHNQSRIFCIHSYSNKIVGKVEVLLHLKPDTDVDTDTSENTDSDKLFIILAATFGVVIAIVTGVCLTCWCSKIKQARLIENAYENFSYENESSIPEFPSQWENYYHDSHYSQIDENAILDNSAYSGDTKKLYATPNTRQIKTPSENVYTEIDEYFCPRNNVAHSTVNCSSSRHIAVYDVLRRSDLISCNNEEKCFMNNSDKISERSNKPKSVNFREGGVVRPACSTGNSSINDTKLKKDNMNSFVEVKGDVAAETNDTQKGVKDTISSVPNDRKINGIEYVEPYSVFSEVYAVNDFYE